MKLSIAPAALAELQGAADFYAEQSGIRLANAFVDEFERVINLIQTNPLLGAPFRSRWRRYFLNKFPFSVIYQSTTDELRVVALAHNSRRPGYWKGRE